MVVHVHIRSSICLTNSWVEDRSNVYIYDLSTEINICIYIYTSSINWDTFTYIYIYEIYIYMIYQLSCNKPKTLQNILWQFMEFLFSVDSAPNYWPGGSFIVSVSNSWVEHGSYKSANWGAIRPKGVTYSDVSNVEISTCVHVDADFQLWYRVCECLKFTDNTFFFFK